MEFGWDLDRGLCWNSSCVICLGMVNVGFKEESGCWKMIEIWLGGICCKGEVDKLVKDCPLKIISPLNLSSP